MVWTLPNLLSLFRIGIIPVLVYLLTFTDRVSAVLAASLFLIASITDYFDGYFARRNRSVSDLGKILDPLADKLMVITVLIMLTPGSTGEPSVPAWLVVVIITRETAVTVIRASPSEGIVMHAEPSGNMFILQAFAVVGLLVHYTYWGVDFFVAGIYFLALSAVVAVWSGIGYHIQFSDCGRPG